MDTNKHIYLVKYYGGDWDSYYETIIFATEVKSRATKYVSKFNRILKKWKQYYSQFEEERNGIVWIKEEHIAQHFDRWISLQNISKCYCHEVKLR